METAFRHTVNKLGLIQDSTLSQHFFFFFFFFWDGAFSWIVEEIVSPMFASFSHQIFSSCNTVKKRTGVKLGNKLPSFNYFFLFPNKWICLSVSCLCCTIHFIDILTHLTVRSVLNWVNLGIYSLNICRILSIVAFWIS